MEINFFSSKLKSKLKLLLDYEKNNTHYYFAIYYILFTTISMKILTKQSYIMRKNFMWIPFVLQSLYRKKWKKHETIKERIGALLEIYLEFLGLDFTPTGSVTLEKFALVKAVYRESENLSYKGARFLLIKTAKLARIDSPHVGCLCWIGSSNVQH